MLLVEHGSPHRVFFSFEFANQIVNQLAQLIVFVFHVDGDHHVGGCFEHFAQSRETHSYLAVLEVVVSVCEVVFQVALEFWQVVEVEVFHFLTSVLTATHAF